MSAAEPSAPLRRLTELASACGCAAKLSPQILEAVLPGLLRSPDPNLLVGYEGAEDAAVYRLGPELALVQTLDFFTPIVDSPEDFGAIAAANALSDVYAMGGRPLTALAIVGFPPREPPELLRRILQGGLDKLAEADCSLGGGHSVRDEELKFGYSITGLIHPDRVLRNRGAQPGDRLFLTKPLGTGVITTALKRAPIPDPTLRQAVEAAVASMRGLNRAASEAALRHGATAATDITGFGLIGHAREMALGSGQRLRLWAHALPLLPGAELYARQSLAAPSQGLVNNRNFAASSVSFAPGLSDWMQALCFDPQTSGGLLVAVPQQSAQGFPGTPIGEVAGEVGGDGIWVTVEN